MVLEGIFNGLGIMYFCSLVAVLSLASYWYSLIPYDRWSLQADRCVFLPGKMIFCQESLRLLVGDFSSPLSVSIF